MIYIWIILLLVIIICLLSIGILLIIKKATYLSKTEKDMCIFTIDMYLDYGEEIGITPEKEKHTIIVNELNKLKEKIK